MSEPAGVEASTGLGSTPSSAPAGVQAAAKRTATTRRVTARKAPRVAATRKTPPAGASPPKKRATPPKKRATPSKARATPPKKRATPSKARATPPKKGASRTVVNREDGPHLSPGERVALGRSARERVPRSSQGTFVTWPDRPDPVALLESQAASRVPELVPIRYGRMLASPFAFYRGAALIMASDLASTPRSGIHVQACGDAHLSNFGAFASPDRALVFDVNDFDETLPGPWEWDVKRLAASLEVGARDLEFSDKERRRIVVGATESYRTRMLGYAGMRNLDVWYSRLDVDRTLAEFGSQLTRAGRKRTETGIAKARTRDSMQAFDKLTTVIDGERRIVSDPPLIVPVEALLPVERDAVSELLYHLMGTYRRTLPSDRRYLLEQFRVVQLARKVVGVGSVGTRAWILLLMGRDDGDPLFLQAKEAQPSVFERFVGKSQYTNAGQRVVAGQHLMQASSDIFLGWERVDGLDGVSRDYYVRQLRDWKGSADVDQLLPTGMAAWGRICGWTLARAHARSGDRIAIAAYLGKNDGFERAIASFADSYADQNERDYATFKKAVAEGRITAETGL